MKKLFRKLFGPPKKELMWLIDELYCELGTNSTNIECIMEDPQKYDLNTLKLWYKWAGLHWDSATKNYHKVFPKFSHKWKKEAPKKEDQ